MKPNEVLNLKANLIEKSKGNNWKVIFDTLLNLPEKVRLSGMGDEKVEVFAGIQEWIIDTTLQTINNNECFFVKEEMSDLVLFASQKLDSTDKVDLSLVPADSGFSYFEKPIEYTNLHGETSLVNLILWKKVFLKDPDQFGIFMSFWNDSSHTPDTRAKTLDLSALMGRFSYIDYQFISEGSEVLGQNLEPTDEEIEKAKIYRNNLLEKLRADGNDVSEFENDDDKQYFAKTNLSRIVWAYFLIMSQTLTEVSKHKSEERAQRRQLERKNIPSEYVVVQFRKRRYLSAETDETKEESAREWSHRWIVGGHWRWQPYKDPVSKGVIHKRIWISPFVKGPGDKPLIAKSKIFVLAK